MEYDLVYSQMDQLNDTLTNMNLNRINIETSLSDVDSNDDEEKRYVHIAENVFLDIMKSDEYSDDDHLTFNQINKCWCLVCKYKESNKID